MFSFTQDVLTQLLSIKNTSPERLSEHERKICDRICHCTQCTYLWIRKFTRLPERCPNCHARDWDRPLITAMLTTAKASTNQPDCQEGTKGEGRQE